MSKDRRKVIDKALTLLQEAEALVDEATSGKEQRTDRFLLEEALDSIKLALAGLKAVS